MNADRKALDEISERVIGCASIGVNTLGTGSLEAVYENASPAPPRRHSPSGTTQLKRQRNSSSIGIPRQIVTDQE
jgi:hypothetical protein